PSLSPPLLFSFYHSLYPNRFLLRLFIFPLFITNLSQPPLCPLHHLLPPLVSRASTTPHPPCFFCLYRAGACHHSACSKGVQALGSVKHLETILLFWHYKNKIELNYNQICKLPFYTLPIVIGNTVCKMEKSLSSFLVGDIQDCLAQAKQSRQQ